MAVGTRCLRDPDICSVDWTGGRIGRRNRVTEGHNRNAASVLAGKVQHQQPNRPRVHGPSRCSYSATNYARSIGILIRRFGGSWAARLKFPSRVIRDLHR